MSEPKPSGAAPARIDLGDLARVTPISRLFGRDRGTPIDRYYIENFLARRAGDIRGRVLEIGSNDYTLRFGGPKVERSDVLDLDPRNPAATIVADLTDCPQIPADSFDAIVLTQVLHMIYDVRAVLASLYRMLRPGGVVVATVPGISQIDSGIGRDSWFWSMTPRCVARLFAEFFPGDGVTVEAHGNVLAAIGFLHGLALEEMDRRDLDHADPLYPLVTTVRALKT